MIPKAFLRPCSVSRNNSSTINRDCNDIISGNTPGHKLLLAVLERALLDFYDYHTFGDRAHTPYVTKKVRHKPNVRYRQHRLHKHLLETDRRSSRRDEGVCARVWVFSDSTEPFAFLWLCDHLFTDPPQMVSIIRKYCREILVVFDQALSAENPTEVLYSS